MSMGGIQMCVCAQVCVCVDWSAAHPDVTSALTGISDIYVGGRASYIVSLQWWVLMNLYSTAFHRSISYRLLY